VVLETGAHSTYGKPCPGVYSVVPALRLGKGLEFLPTQPWHFTFFPQAPFGLVRVSSLMWSSTLQSLEYNKLHGLGMSQRLGHLGGVYNYDSTLSDAI